MKRILGIAMVLGSLAFIAGCSKEKAAQIKVESADKKFETASKEKDITEEPTKKRSAGKEEVVDLSSGVKLDLVLIPAGDFIIGSPASEKGRINDEKQHEVTITKPFYMGKYEVMQEQWEAVMGSNPSGRNKGAKLPVTDVTWNDCHDFIKKLNAKTDGGYRLPTEAEWEYACRAGTTTAYSFGDEITPKDANYSDSKIGKPVAAGSYKPNAFGLYDMHGNVGEWCEDWYGFYPAGALTDPKGPATGERRVVRSISFGGSALKARSSYRNLPLPQTSRTYVTGFRLARTP